MNLFGEIGFLFSQIFMRPIFNGLMLLYHLFGDFGLSIVVLTLIIKLLLFPLTLKQLKSMKANQQLQPQIQEIRKKYAKDQKGTGRALTSALQRIRYEPTNRLSAYVSTTACPLRPLLRTLLGGKCRKGT